MAKQDKRHSFERTVYGVGILGIEDTRDSNGKLYKSYNTWYQMMTRCYDDKYQKKKPTYKGCIVCDEWHYYPNFKLWFQDNYYEIKGKTMNLDKDILVKGNKVYSPDTCVFVPNDINMQFRLHSASRNGTPIGVYYRKDINKYTSRIKKGNQCISLGVYSTAEEAFMKFKYAKESTLKELADKYKNDIPYKLYEAMYQYEVEITD